MQVYISDGHLVSDDDDDSQYQIISKYFLQGPNRGWILKNLPLKNIFKSHSCVQTSDREQEIKVAYKIPFTEIRQLAPDCKFMTAIAFTGPSDIDFAIEIFWNGK